MKVFKDANWMLSHHFFDHVLSSDDYEKVADNLKDHVLLIDGKTYWPKSLAAEAEKITVWAAYEIEQRSGWVPTIKQEHRSVAWKRFTKEGIELHLSVEPKDDDFVVHAYPTRNQQYSGRGVSEVRL